MTRSKRFNKLLNKTDGTKGSVFDTDGNLIGRGNISYERKENGRGLYLNGKQIPLSSVRSVTPNFNNSVSLIFVDSAYNIVGDFQ